MPQGRYWWWIHLIGQCPVDTVVGYVEEIEDPPTTLSPGMEDHTGPGVPQGTAVSLTDRMAAAASTGHCPAISAQPDEGPAGLGITQGITFPARDCERLITSSNTRSDLINPTVIASQGVNHGMSEINNECVRVVAPMESEFSTDNSVNIGERENGPSNGIQTDELESDSSVSERDIQERESDIAVPPHLTELYQTCTRDCTSEERQAIGHLLNEFENVFSKHDNDLGQTNLLEHVIDTGDAAPVKLPPRRVPLAFAGEDKAALEKLQEQGTIRPSCSPWAAPLVLVRKKCGSVRTCVDYRRLNLLTRKDAWPIPRIQDCLDALEGSILFSTLDITSAYNQIPVREEDIPKTAFVTRNGLYEFTTMPFGLTGASATFQRLMEIALSGLQWSACLIYLDDVIIFSQTFDKHLERIRLVLDRIAEAGLKLKPRKCHLFAKEVTFLGHKLSSHGVLPNPDNVQKLLDWPVPRTVTEVRGFLGLGNYYRRFVRNFSQTAQPLINLTKKGIDFHWSLACQEAFDQLKRTLCSPEVMAYPSSEGLFILDTDASDHSVGAVLSQVQGNYERVIAYGSHALNKAERNYCVTDRELLAVKHFVEYYRQYLLGRKFLIRTDHQALRWLFSLREPKARIARWIEILSAFHFEIEYRPGQKHGNADALSRCPEPQQCRCSMAVPDLRCGPWSKCRKKSAMMQSSWKELHGDEIVRRVSATPKVVGLGWRLVALFSLIFGLVGMILLWFWDKLGSLRSSSEWLGGLSFRSQTRICRLSRGSPPSSQGSTFPLSYSMKTLRSLQLSDKDLAQILKWKQSGQRPFGPVVCRSSPVTRHYWNQWDTLEVRDGILYRRYTKQDCSGSYIQFLVPASLRKEILKLMHDSPISGHLGKKKTCARVLQHFYWYGIRDDVQNWIRQCDTCGSIKAPPRRYRAPLGVMPVGAPLDRLGTDFLGPLPLTPRGNRHILVVTDYFTKWVEIFAVPDQTAVTTAEVILNEVIARFGCPYEIHSDQGRNFESQIFAELCRLLEVRKTRTSPGNPKCNGQTERFNKTLIRLIKAYLKGQDREWDRNLGCLAAAYRASQHESTHMTPNLLMLGREVRLPAEIMFGSGTSHVGETVTSYGEFVDHLKSRKQKAHELARSHLGVVAEREKKRHDFKLNLKQYHQGDLVWVRTDKNQLHITPKLRCAYQGPYLVLHRVNDLDYVIQLNAQGKRQLIHHDRLKPYEGQLRLKWSKKALKQFRNSPRHARNKNE